MYVIYKHTNTQSGKCYVGKSKHGIDKRWQEHVFQAIKGAPFRFHAAIRKYPLDSWTHEVLEEVETLETANLCEVKWIAQFQSSDPTLGYNMTFGGEGGKMPDDVQRRIGNKLKGKPKSEEHRQRIREAAKRHWASSPDAENRKRVLAERNQTDEARQLSAETQRKRWASR